MKWWTSFPRKVGTPAKFVCKTAEEFGRAYNRLNGSVNKLYVGLYSCDELGNTDEVTLDVVALDIDWEGKYDTMVEIHNRLLKDNITHQVMFSTNGFWIYIMCEPKRYKQSIAKGKLAAMQEHVLEGTSAFFGASKEAPVDRAIRGDTERLTRMPSSYDKTRGRYVIFLSEMDIKSGYDEIVKLSTTVTDERRFQVITFCTDGVKLDPDKFEAKAVYNNVIYNELTNAEYDYKIAMNTMSDQHKKMFEIIPKFMHGWVLNKDMATWQARAFITLFLREKGFSIEQTKAFLRPYYEAMERSDEYGNNWRHYEKVKAAELIYKRTDLKFPNYKGLYELGLCTAEEVAANGTHKSAAYR